MARKKDAEDDPQAKLIAEQLNEFTVGPPQASTGLIGDQTPENIFDSDDFDRISNQITLQMKNVEVLNLLNTIGEITGTNSSSGPLLGSGQVAEVLDTTGSGVVTSELLVPRPGEAYEVTALDWGTKNASACYLRIRDVNASSGGVLVEYKTAADSFDITLCPLRIVYPQKLVIIYGTATGDNQTNLAYHRIR